MEKEKNLLRELNFNVNSSGFIYWLEALKYIKKCPLNYDIMNVYEYIANKYLTSISLVERNMRTAKQTAIKQIQAKYNYHRKISNSTFLNLVRIDILF